MGPRRNFFVFSTQSCVKRSCDWLFDINALDGKAGLAAIRETAPDGGARGDVEIGIGENDHGVFAAELEHGRNQFRCARFSNVRPGGDAAGEEYFCRGRLR